MIIRVYAIYDQATEMFMQPMFQPTEQAMLRLFMRIVLDRETEISQHPKHFTLFRIGEYDNNSGALKADKRAIITAVEMQAIAYRDASQTLSRTEVQRDIEEYISSNDQAE